MQHCDYETGVCVNTDESYVCLTVLLLIANLVTNASILAARTLASALEIGVIVNQQIKPQGSLLT